MRVALDTNALYVTKAGTARYIRGLRRGLARVPQIEVLELAWRVENFDYRQPQRSLKTLYRELVWTPLVAPWRVRRLRADLLHGPAGSATAASCIKNVVTLHDLAVLRHPERFRRWQRVRGRRNIRHLAKADRVICISRFTADEAMKLTALPASKITVVYNGGDFHADGERVAECCPETHIPEQFFLFVGSLEPGKNLALLREVYRLAEDRGVEMPALVIVGVRWQGVGSEGQPPAGWIYLGGQPDEVLVYLYRRAVALVFPTKYEGFGLPVAEAMTLGCPVICSAVASLPEVAGDAALYAEQQPTCYLDAMTTLLKDASAREQMRAQGIMQAKQFSWARCAAETSEVYRAALA